VYRFVLEPKPSTMRLPRTAFILCTTAFALVHRPVHAGEPAESLAEANALTAKAAALYDEGVVAYKKGRWAVARASFLAAWSLKKHWQVAGNLADCELQMGKTRDAAEHAAFYLRNAPADRRERAQALLDKAQAGTGTLTVAVDQIGADVVVDGAIVGKSPLLEPVFVDPGQHTVEARLRAGFATAPVDVLAGVRKDVALVLKEAQTPPIRPVRSAPSAPVRPGPSVTIIIAGAAVSGVGIVVGTALAMFAHGKASDADTKLATLPAPIGMSPCAMFNATCDAINRDRHARDALSNASMGTVIAAGAVALSTVGYAVFARRGQPAAPVQALAAVGSGQGGFVLAGAW
jgi:hypothetical protein